MLFCFLDYWTPQWIRKATTCISQSQFNIQLKSITAFCLIIHNLVILSKLENYLCKTPSPPFSPWADYLWTHAFNSTETSLHYEGLCSHHLQDLNGSRLHMTPFTITMKAEKGPLPRLFAWSPEVAYLIVGESYRWTRTLLLFIHPPSPDMIFVHLLHHQIQTKIFTPLLCVICDIVQIRRNSVNALK